MFSAFLLMNEYRLDNTHGCYHLDRNQTIQIILQKGMNFIQFAFVTGMMFSFVSSLSVQSYNEYAKDTNSGIFTVYESATDMKTAGITSFSITFDKPLLNTPELIIAIVDFTQGSNFDQNLLNIEKDTLSLIGFSIKAQSNYNNLLYKIRISYLGFHDVDSNIYVIQIEHDLFFSNLASGTGERTEATTGNFFSLTSGSKLNNDLTKNLFYAFILGYQIFTNPGSGYTIRFELTLQNSVSFKTTIYAIQSERLYTLRLNYFFMDKQPSETKDIVIAQQYIQFPLDGPSFDLIHANTKGDFLIGLTEFTGKDLSNPNNLQLKLTIDKPNNNLDISISNSELAQVKYIYFYIAQKYCQTPTPYFSTNQKQQCTDQCKSDQTQSPTSTICEVCSSSCSTCQELKDKCTACPNGYTLNNNQCEEQVTPPQPQPQPEPQPEPQPQPQPQPQPEPAVPNNSTNQEPSSQERAQSLGLLGLLALIPIILSLLIIYYLVRRRSTRIKVQQLRNQPSLDRL